MSYETNDKMVSHPDHYKSGKYEVIDIIDEFTKDLSGTEAVCTANAIKYILRWKKKNGIQDVKKAIWYLQHMVDKEEERLQEEHDEFDEELLKKKEEDLKINTCKECRYFPEIYCSFTGWPVTADKPMCACFEEKNLEDPFVDIHSVKDEKALCVNCKNNESCVGVVYDNKCERFEYKPIEDIQPIKDDAKYTKKVDLKTGEVTVTPLNKTTYSKEFVDKALNHIRENSVYGIPKEPSEEENCAHCENFNLEPNGILGHCKHSIYSDGRVHRDCVCSNFKKKLEDPFVDIQPIKDNTKYTKEVDLSTGKVTIISQTCDNCKFKSKKFIEHPCCVCHNHSKWEEKKLEPGCDKCEISECKFLEDPFMNPPYNELLDKCRAQKEIINDLLRDKKEMQDSIDILIDDKKKLKIEKHEILMDLESLIYDDLNTYSYIDENSNRPDIVHRACICAGIDVQNKKSRYFNGNNKEEN